MSHFGLFGILSKRIVTKRFIVSILGLGLLMAAAGVGSVVGAVRHPNEDMRAPSMLDNQLIDVIVELAVLRTQFPGPTVTVTQLVKRRLRATEVVRLQAWAAQIGGRNAIDQSTTETNKTLIFEYDCLSKISNGFRERDELVLVYEIVNRTKFIVTNAVLLNRTVTW